MCGKPKVNYQNPEADARIAAEKATIAANKDRAARKVRAGRDTLQSSSALGAVQQPAPSSALGQSSAPTGGLMLKMARRAMGQIKDGRA